MKSSVAKSKSSYASLKVPDFLDDYFVWGKRTYIKLASEPTVYFVVDSGKNICETVRIKEDDEIEGKRVEGSKTKVAYFSISNLVEYPPVAELHSPSMFSFYIVGMDGVSEKIQPASLDEIVGELKSRGLFQQANRAMDVITNAINALKNNRLYETKNKSPYPGFFKLNGKFVSTKTYALPNESQMAEAIQMFNDFGEHYNEFAPKLGYIAHWMIMAPFSFVIKQKGKGTKLNNLFLYGTTRTGKSTIAKLSCFMWSRGIDGQLKSGSHVHSVYQYGRAISESTFPIIVDEGEGLFKAEELSSLMKTATHTLSARARYNNYLQREEEVMALSLSIITSNYNKPNDGALGARLDLMKYTSTSIRSKEDRIEFERKFQPDVQDGPLKALQHIGNYVAVQITADSTLLAKDWLEVSKLLWKDMYELAGIEMPEWMRNIGAPETVEEAFVDEKDYYESNIKSLIIRKAEPQTHMKGIREKRYITPRDKAEDVVLNSREPWIQYYQPNTGSDAHKEFVLIEKSIETDLRKEKQINIQLDRIAELLGGTIKRKTIEKRKITVAVFDYNEFLDLF